MASGGFSGRAASGSRSFDFGSDDVLCSYDDYATEDASKGKRSDPSGKEFHESRMGRPLVRIYEQEDYPVDHLLPTVEKCMKKYADDLLRFLEGISGRLSQLEIHCSKLERSIGEFRADVVREQAETNMKFKSLEKHLQEVHRSVQILRDKQELAEAQKELANLQMVQKESIKKNENGVKQPTEELKKLDDKPDMASMQLALVLSHQATAPTVLPVRTTEQIQPYKELSMQRPATASPKEQQDQYVSNQTGTYYAQHQLFPQDQHGQTVQPQLQYVQSRPQLQAAPIQALPQQQILNQNQSPPYPQYQQQWPQQPTQQFPQQVMQPQQVVQQQQPASQAQIRPQIPPSFPPYPSQPVNPVPETYPSSIPVQVPYATVPQPSTNRPDVVPFGYGGQSSSVSQPTHHTNIQRPTQPPTSQGSFAPQPNKVGYISAAPYSPAYGASGYNTAYSYQTSNPPPIQNQQLTPSVSLHQTGPQVIRNHPYGEMIEKAVGMGYPREQIVSIIQRIAESGQPMDFNVLLDRLNGQTAGATPRAW